MSKKRKIVIIISVCILILLAIIFFASRKDNSVNYITERVSVQDLKKTVSVTGELVSENELSLNFEMPGKVNWTGFVGQKVTAGDILGQIDDATLNKEVEKARLALEKAQAEAGISDDQVNEADQNVSNAKKYLEGIKELEDQKVEAADQAYEDASDYYDTALDYYNKIVDEQGTEDNSAALYAKLTLDTALKNKHAAETAKETARKSRDATIQSAENSYKLAKDQLKTVESDFAKVSKNAAVGTARVNYEIALENLEKSALRSPVNGIVTRINYKIGEVLGSATVSEPFAKVLSYDFIIESNVPESDIAQIKLGQTAEITFDALSEDDLFSGEVVEIEPASTVIQDVVYYKVKFKLNNFDQQLKAGMSCDIEVKIDEREDVLAIAQRAVEKDESGRSVVKILSENGQVEQIEVKIGLKDDGGMVEIISGLKEGDEVVVMEKE
jgi:RND family efflux transporter MFP subunit